MTKVKEKPILFNGDMVRAILEGRKTQTRRPLKPQPHSGVRRSIFCKSGIEDGHGYEIKWPYAIGERLWVRETFIRDSLTAYRADFTDKEAKLLLWKPSIHMPRASSRINLEITNVRVERLYAMTILEASSEGFNDFAEFVRGWNAIYGKQQELSFEANPWVWVVEFKKV